MTRLVFTDTETTSLRPDRRAWEIGLIVRDPGQADVKHRWFVNAEDLDMGGADAMALKIGRFYSRHPDYSGASKSDLKPEADALYHVERLTRGAHLIGAVVSFDAEVLGTRMRAHGILPSWHYHLVDVEALAAGWLHRDAAVKENREHSLEEASWQRHLASPPWNSDELTAALGVSIREEDRHTALGDARWAAAVYDAVTGRLS